MKQRYAFPLPQGDIDDLIFGEQQPKQSEK